MLWTTTENVCELQASILIREQPLKIRFCNCRQTTADGYMPIVFGVAKSKKPHTIAELLTEAYVSEMTTTILGNEARKKLE